MIDPATGNYNALTEFGVWPNPMARLVYNNDKLKSTRLLGSAYVEIKFTKDLMFKSSFGVDGTIMQERVYNPQYTLNGGTQSNTATQLTRTLTNNTDTYWDNTLTFTKKLGQQIT